MPPSRDGVLATTTCPLWYLAVSFSAGILVRPRGMVFPSLAVAAGLWVVRTWVVRRWGDSWWCTLLALTAAALAGGGWFGFQGRDSDSADRLGRVLETVPPEATVRIVGVLEKWPEPAPDRCYFEVATTGLHLPDGVRPVRGTARVSVPAVDDPRRWPPGTTVELDGRLTHEARYRNPGGAGFDLESSAIDAVGGAIGPPRILAVGTTTGWRGLPGRLRLAAFDLLDREFEPKTAGVLKASLLGGRHFLDRRWADRFRDSGTFHLLVISGSHLALLAWFVHFVTGRSTRFRAVGISVTCGVVWMYAVLVGNDPPVLRAAVGVTVWQLSRLFHRRPDPLNAVGLAVLVLLVGNPNNLFLPSFQLTVGAVLVLVAGVAPFWTGLRDIGRWRPRRATPLPPRCPLWVRWLGEALFWESRAFAESQRHSPVTFRLEKSPVAGWLDGPVFSLGWRRGVSVSFAPRRLIQGTVLLVIATTGIQLALLPLNVAYFNRVSPGGIVANLCAEIVMALIVAAGVPYFLLAGLLPGWEMALVPLLDGLVSLLVRSAGLSSHSIRLPHLVGTWTWLYAAHGAACAGVAVGLRWWNPWTRGTRWPGRLVRWGAAVALAASVAMGTLPRNWVSDPAGRLRVTFLDVGQGDSILVEFPNGQTMLVDAGGIPRFGPAPPVDFQPDGFRIGEQVVSRFLWSRGIRHLDYLVVTHGDADHLQGFTEVTRNFSVGAAFYGYIDDTDDTRWLTELARRGVPVTGLRAGQRWSCGAATVEVAWPPSGETPSSDNDSSVVLRVSMGQRGILLTGDIERVAEARLVCAPETIRCDVLKAPHHGSRTSSSPGFLAAAAPAAVVFCAPRVSRFGHPHPEVVARYREASPGMSIWQTGRDGAVTVETDGSTLRIASWWTKRTFTSPG